MSIPLTGRTAEAALHKLVLDECIDDAVVNYVMPEGKPHAWESGLWDYKRSLPSTSGRGTAEEKAAAQDALAELVKDVVAFHNAYGGYIIAGVDQHANDPIVGCNELGIDGFTIEKLNEQLVAYTRTKINCRFKILADSAVVILIPMRKPGTPVVTMARGAPERAKGRPAFKKGDIYARIDDACLPVQSDLQGLQFVCSPRDFGLDVTLHRVENNLPARDPNLIRFIGRTEYLLRLWSWLTDRHTAVKVLTALGGTGKTAIAYEFCQQLMAGPRHG
jgi:hypothetical protein